MPKLLVVDTSYAFEAIRARGLEESVTCRDLGGFFEHVWTVHPFASLVSEDVSKFGRPEVHSLGERHTFIDGKIGRSDHLSALGVVNFFAGQGGLFLDLVRLVREEKISAVRAGDPLYAGLLGLALSRTCNIPLVVRVNANYDNLYRATGKPMMPRFFRSMRVEKVVVRHVLSRAALVAAVNEDNRKFAVLSGARPDRTTLFPYGNLLDKRHVAAPETRDRSWTPLAEYFPNPVPFVLHVGRLSSQKFPDDPIRVLAEIRRRGHDVKAVMVGDGPLRESLGALARELGVEEHVAFCGNRDQQWLSHVIPLASAVVSPLTGRALSEVAFGGAAIAAYDLDWQGDLIRTGETGELIPFREPMKMADGVERFLTDPDYARRMGEAVRRRAFEMLDPATLDAHERDQYAQLFRRFGARST